MASTITERNQQMSVPTRTIAFVGAHGTGKTTLINALRTRLNKGGMAVTVTQEVPRKICARVNDLEFFRRDKNTLVRQMLILVAQMTLESEPTSALRLTDRTILDHWAYTKLLFSQDLNQNQISEPLSYFIERYCSAAYNKICYIPPEFPPIDDGTRESSSRFQLEVDDMIRVLLADFSINYETVRGSVPERLEQVTALI